MGVTHTPINIRQSKQPNCDSTENGNAMQVNGEARSHTLRCRAILALLVLGHGVRSVLVALLAKSVLLLRVVHLEKCDATEWVHEAVR